MKQTKGFSPEHTAIIDGWCQAYPYRKGIGLATIRANPEENIKLQSMLAEGHTEKTIYHKGYYHRMNVICDIPKKASLRGTQPAKPRADGRYPCYLCSHVSESKQGLGSHVRYSHPGQSRTAHWKRGGKAKVIASVNHRVIGTVALVSAPGTVTVHVPPALIGQFIIVDVHGNVKEAKLLNHCPECGTPAIKAYLAAANI